MSGMKLIQQAYEDRHQSLLDEVNKWKWISEEQSVQMSQLETFRKAIVSMVDQHSGVSLTQLEQSILETIEADAEHVSAEYDVADADTSSFILDGDVESSFSPRHQKHAKGLESRGSNSAPVSTSDDEKQSSAQAFTVSETIHADEIQGRSRRESNIRRSKDDQHQYASQGDSEMTKVDHSSFNNQRQQQSTSGSSGVDASAFTLLYKEIRDSMDATSFGLFARVVTAFNEGEKTTDETLQEVGKIVKDRALNQRFKNLIEQAIAEKESQLDEAGNETMDGDRSLFMGVVEEDDEEPIDEEDQEENISQDEDFGSMNDSTDMGIADRKEFSSGNVGDVPAARL
ncbi:hypothetical protein BGZ59_006014 [Podila verticillata]|nr:hypothetical protein BGZ59_006014 [Podila verticillata]